MGAGTWWLLPGTLCTAEVFAPVLDALGVPRARWWAVALDRPTVDDYGRELAGMGPQDVALGFSLGAILLAHHLDRITGRAAVLLSANPFADLPERLPGRRDLQAQVEAHGGAATLRDRMAGLIGPEVGPDHPMADRITAMAAETEALIGPQTELALSRPGAEAALRQARLPVLFLTGARDPAAPPERAEQAAALGGHRFERLPGGHFLPLEHPEAVAGAMRHFFEDKDLGPC